LLRNNEIILLERLVDLEKCFFFRGRTLTRKRHGVLKSVGSRAHTSFYFRPIRWFIARFRSFALMIPRWTRPWNRSLSFPYWYVTNSCSEDKYIVHPLLSAEYNLCLLQAKIIYIFIFRILKMHNLYLKSDISSDVSNNVQHSYDCIKLLLDETRRESHGN